MSRLSFLLRTYGLDALIVLVAVGGALDVALRQGEPDGPSIGLWFAVPAVVLVVVPLLARRRLPFAAPVGVWLVAAAVSFVDGRLIVDTFSATVAGMLATFLLGHLRDAAQARFGLAVAVGAVAIVLYNDPNRDPGDFFFVPVLFAIAWLAGFALRERATHAEAAEERAALAEREREAAARVAVAEERARIARELHDVVAHSVSVMVLHVGAVRRRMPAALEEEAEALKGVERTGRNALAEMRLLLGALRDAGDDVELAPQPGLDDLDSLLEQVGRAGLPVRLHVDGKPAPLPRSIDLSAYRIVQEGLTNALKHAGARQADVTVRYGADDLQIEVRDDGNGALPGDGLGHGLVGVRERVTIYGGEMSAGTATGGGFVLSTRLPHDGRRP